MKTILLLLVRTLLSHTLWSQKALLREDKNDLFSTLIFDDDQIVTDTLFSFNNAEKRHRHLTSFAKKKTNIRIQTSAMESFSTSTALRSPKHEKKRPKNTLQPYSIFWDTKFNLKEIEITEGKIKMDPSYRDISYAIYGFIQDNHVVTIGFYSHLEERERQRQNILNIVGSLKTNQSLPNVYKKQHAIK